MKTDREALIEIGNIIGAPTMSYCPEYAVKELQERVGKVSDIIIAQLGLTKPVDDPEKHRTNPGLTIATIDGIKYVGGPLHEHFKSSDSGKVPGQPD